ncbi:MAG: hypothetical protein ABW166_14790 [Sedimenticola sp.]
MKETTRTIQEWVQIIEDELLAGNTAKALEIQSQLNKTKNINSFCQPVYSKGWQAFNDGNLLVAKSLFSWLEKIDPENWSVQLANATIREKLNGKHIASEKFKGFVKLNPAFHYQHSNSQNPIKTATLLTIGRGDTSFTNGGFRLPYGLTEAQHLTQHPEYTASMLFSEGLSLRQINQFDVLLNAISDADIYPDLLKEIIILIADNKVPVINQPQHILNNTRDNIVRNIPTNAEQIIPKTVRANLIEEQADSLVTQVKNNKLNYPILIRPVGSQTGQGLFRLNSEEKAKEYQHKTGEFYITEFYDFKSTDGYYRKYRLWNIGGTIIPNHLFISEKWNVHAGCRLETMIKNQWMLDEEKSFVLGCSKIDNDRISQLMTTLQHETHLDYFGVDLAFTPKGIPIFFEANPTMRSHHPEWWVQFPYIKDVDHKHRKAFQNLIEVKKG